MKRLLVTAGVLLVLGVVTAVFAWPHDTARVEVTPVDRAATSTASTSSVPETRTVLVADRGKLGENDGTLRVGYERGVKPPAASTDAVVTTDENCTPDAQGVSHCSNDIRLADGDTIRVRHDHVMHEVPCLVPGERVQLRAA